jgi:hypothetical protein
MSRRLLVFVLIALIAGAALAAGMAVAGKDEGNGEDFAYAVGLWGTFPTRIPKHATTSARAVPAIPAETRRSTPLARPPTRPGCARPSTRRMTNIPPA